MLARRWRQRLKMGVTASLLGASLLLAWYTHYRTTSLIEVVHLPQTYSRRSGDLSANISLHLHRAVRHVRFRLNDGPWRVVDRWSPRTPRPLSTIELRAEELQPGLNEVAVEVSARGRPTDSISRSFRYDPTPIELPLKVGWKERDIEVQDGFWETVRTDGVWRVRPRPGYEGYDRILAVTGAFPVDRRVETDVIFHHHTLTPDHVGAREFAFGVLSLWGGHPDDGGYFPRRGWSFAMAWYWSKPGGVGNEISYKNGAGQPVWVQGYRNQELVVGAPYRLIVEVRDVRDLAGLHTAYHQRFKWWRAGTPRPARWLELADVDGSPLPEGEYSVALMAFNCQVEFGPVRVEPLQ